MNESAQQITRLLSRIGHGDDGAAEQLMPLLYADLHARAAAMMRRERRAVTLQPTALLHEAWVRLQEGGNVSYADRAHFLRLAGRVMRNVLVDHARRRRHAKIVGDEVDLEVAIGPGDSDRTQVLDLQEALQHLAERDPELEQIVELRFFGGLNLEETAQVIGKTVSSVYRAWELARAFLLRELRRGADD